MVIFKFFLRTEKNACVWSQEKIKELFTNLKLEGDNGLHLSFVLSLYYH